MGHTMLLGFRNLSDSTLLAHPVSTLHVRIAASRDKDMFYYVTRQKIIKKE
jgi:hypothetical protein